MLSVEKVNILPDDSVMNRFVVIAKTNEFQSVFPECLAQCQFQSELKFLDF
jgi:hypothetical protein